jgi:hypothetical protein
MPFSPLNGDFFQTHHAKRNSIETALAAAFRNVGVARERQG